MIIPEPFEPDTPQETSPLTSSAAMHPYSGSWAISGLFLLAVLTFLYFARNFVLPIMMALILSLVFLPAVRYMKKLGIPAPLGSGVIVLGLVAVFTIGAYNLVEPAGKWFDRAPQSLREIDVKLRRLMGSVQDVAMATAQVEDITQQIAKVGSGNTKIQEVVIKESNLAGIVLGATGSFLLTALSTLILLYFLMAGGDLFLRKTISALPRLTDKKRAVDIAHQVESAVSTYLLTVSIINVALGSAVALVMYLLGVPNPLLWGVMVGVFNFIPYLGDIASIIVLTLVGLLTFDELWLSLSVPGIFCLLTITEGYLLTPLIVGRRLSLNPVVIVLSVLFWGWMWGMPGALLAVPMLIALKTFFDRVRPLQVFGEFLGA